MRQFSESTFSQHSLIHFLITRGLRPLVMYGNELTCAEKKSIPRIASSGKDTFQFVNRELRHCLCKGLWVLIGLIWDSGVLNFYTILKGILPTYEWRINLWNNSHSWNFTSSSHKAPKQTKRENNDHFDIKPSWTKVLFWNKNFISLISQKT